MSEDRTQRRLAAIVAIDVAGYSKMMGRDEVGTLARLKTIRAEFVHSTIPEHGGRIVKTTGDGTLIEFPSAVEAVLHAVEVQRGLARYNAGLAAEARILLRIGVNVGDIIVDDQDIYGDGVNVAARLEALSEPGHIYLSARVVDHVRGRADIAFDDLGLHALKNIDEPVHVFRARLGEAPAEEIPAVRAALPLPDKPSIAVLPFDSWSAAEDQDHFSDGIVEDIITALARFPRLFVVARNSSFTYKNRATDVRVIGRELGVRYVLEGSIRRAGERLRLTAQLIDASDGTHLWAERFDGKLEDVFDLQDQIAALVIAAVAPRIQAAEIERARRRRPESLDAYDLYLRALSASRDMTREDSDRALSFIDRALEIDPDYAVAAALGAWLYTLRVPQGWLEENSAEKRRAISLARLAILRGEDDSDALAHGGYAIGFLTGSLREGLNAVQRAIELNRNSALAFTHSGWLTAYLGDAGEAISDFEKAMRLSPRDPALFRSHAGLAFAHLLRQEFEQAAEWGWKAVNENPNFSPAHRALAAALAHAGRLDEARRVVAQLKLLVPGLTVSRFAGQSLFMHSGRIDTILSGLRMAGLPD